jgi:hypothetical protein
MATAPAFASTPRAASALLGAVETDLQAPAQSVTVFTAGASGSKVEEIVVQASKSGTLIASTVAGLVYIFLHDGTTYHLFDTITVSAVTASATVPGFRGSNRYANLFLPTGWSIRISQSHATNANILKATVLGADL